MTNSRIPGTAPTAPARHNEALQYRQKVEKRGQDVTVTAFLTHPAGNRATRRQKQRHWPYFTKTSTRGRLWRTLLREQQRQEASG